MSLKSLLRNRPDEEYVNIPRLNLLDIKGVYAIPGVMQTGNIPLPAPFFDFRKSAFRRKNVGPMDNVYWLQGDIERWVEKLRKRRVIR